MALFLLLAAAAVVYGTETCYDKLRPCDAYRELKRYISHERFVLSKELVNDVCSAGKLEKFRECVTNTSCEGHLDGRVGRFVETSTYICSEKVKPELLAHIDGCAREARRDLPSCANHLRGINSSSADCSQKQEDYYKCRENKVAEHCSRTFAHMFNEATRKMDKIIVCDDDDAGHDGAVYQHFAPVWMVHFVVWTLLTRWLAFW